MGRPQKVKELGFTPHLIEIAELSHAKQEPLIIKETEEGYFYAEMPPNHHNGEWREFDMRSVAVYRDAWVGLSELERNGLEAMSIHTALGICKDLMKERAAIGI